MSLGLPSIELASATQESDRLGLSHTVCKTEDGNPGHFRSFQGYEDIERCFCSMVSSREHAKPLARHSKQ